MQNDTQHHQVIAQQIQQRQILSLMGINVWATRDAPTQTFDNSVINSLICKRRLTRTKSANDLNQPDNLCQPNNLCQPDNLRPADTLPQRSATEPTNAVAIPIGKDDVAVTDAVVTDGKALDTTIDSPSDIQTPVAPMSTMATKSTVGRGHNTIPAFTLVGAKYKAWVLMVDAIVFETPELAKLWDNIVQSLALTTHSISFPFCDNMQDEAIANASLSGFIFSIAACEDTQVAILTQLPYGLNDERIIQAPHLKDMLNDSQLKRQLWELIR